MQPSSPPAPPPGNRPGSRRTLWIVLGAVALLVVILLVAVAAWVTLHVLGSKAEGAGSTGSLRIVPVASSAPGACPSGGQGVGAVDGRTCYRLGPGGMTVQRLESADAEPDPSGGRWHISVRLNDDDARRFTQLTRQYVNHQLALVSAGKVVAAPRVQQPISGAELQIAGDFTADEAKKIAGNLPA